jgi:hypothetical protein
MRLTLLIALLALLVAAAPARAAGRSVPQGWLGVVADGPLDAGDTAEWDLMVPAGVESVRTAAFWPALQPSAAAPPDLSALDALVANAAQRGLALVPVVYGTPAWAAAYPGELGSPPRDAADYARLLTALIDRYGPAGTLWTERPELPRRPVRAWQIWNEPNLASYWSQQPFAGSYVGLLRVAHAAIRAADPGARIVLGGLPNFSWRALRTIYAAGGRGLFDAVALHPYTRRPVEVLRIVDRVRRVMRAHRDGRRTLWLTEISWPAAKGKPPHPVGIEVTDRGQAIKLGRALKLLAKARKRARIERVFWYTWISDEGSQSIFEWSGLRRLRGGTAVSAPALAMFQSRARELEGCAKSTDARVCA